MRTGWIMMIGVLAWGWACSAQALERRIGARPMGMGDAFLALADNMDALNYNPAGLALQKNIESSLEYANLYPGLRDGLLQENHLSYSQSLYDSGGFGAAWNNRSLSGIYSENEFLFGYALQPNPALPLWAGATAKIYYLGYSDAASLEANDYFSGQNSKMQVGFDLGVLYEVFKEGAVLPGVRTGLALFNLNQPDLGLRSQAPEPLGLRWGAAGAWQDWDAALDLVYSDGDVQVHAGGERWFDGRRWGVRTGFMAGAGTSTTLSVGGTYAFELATLRLRVNYAFNYPLSGIQETAGIHRVALDFMLPLPTKEELKKIEAERQQRIKKEFEEQRRRAFAMFEKTRGALVELEIKPAYREHKDKIGEWKNDLLSVSNLMAQTQYGSAIRELERINANIAQLRGEPIEKQTAVVAPAGEPAEQEARKKQLIKKVKMYVMRKAIDYFELRQKLKALRKKATPDLDQELYDMEMRLFEGRDKILVYRDLRGFIGIVNEVSEQFEKFKRITGKNPGEGF